MKCISRQFGELEFEEHHIIRFPKGIIGFDQLREFLVINDEDSQPFRWLVSVEDQDFGFAMIDPFLLKPDYRIDVSPETEVYVVAVLREAIEESTVNMKSPILINNRTRTAEQIILDSEAYTVEYPLVPGARQMVGG